VGLSSIEAEQIVSAEEVNEFIVVEKFCDSYMKIGRII
jgi:hypothetical protein